MSNAPKKIYYDDFAGTVNREWMVGDTAYIRADIVGELVEALEAWINSINIEGEEKAMNKARAALAKLEESHE